MRFFDQTTSSDLIWSTRSHPKRVIALDYGHGTCLSRLRTARGKKVSYAQRSGDYECDSRAAQLGDTRVQHFIEIRGPPKRRANEQDARLITERHGKRAFERKTRRKAR